VGREGSLGTRLETGCVVCEMRFAWLLDLSTQINILSRKSDLSSHQSVFTLLGFRAEIKKTHPRVWFQVGYDSLGSSSFRTLGTQTSQSNRGYAFFYNMPVIIRRAKDKLVCQDRRRDRADWLIRYTIRQLAQRGLADSPDMLDLVKDLIAPVI
jgi:hypothetical protein